MMPAAVIRTGRPAPDAARAKPDSKADARADALRLARQRTACLAVAWGVHKTLEVLEDVLADDAQAARLLADVRERHGAVIHELRITHWSDISAGARREMESITTRWMDLREEHLHDLWHDDEGCSAALSPAGWAAWIGALSILVHDVCAVQRRGLRDPWSKLRTGMERLWWSWLESSRLCDDMVRTTALYVAMAEVLPPLGGQQAGPGR